LTTYTLHIPTVAMPKATNHGLAPRPASLDGKRIGLLWNAKVNADIYLKRLQELLEQKYTNMEFVHRAKPTASKPMEPEVFAALRDCDVVVTAFGD